MQSTVRVLGLSTPDIDQTLAIFLHSILRVLGSDVAVVAIPNECWPRFHPGAATLARRSVHNPIRPRPTSDFSPVAHETLGALDPSPVPRTLLRASARCCG